MRPEYTASRLIPYPVVLDSCVIFPMHLRDTLFRAAEIGLYDLYWSQEILDGRELIPWRFSGMRYLADVENFNLFRTCVSMP